MSFTLTGIHLKTAEKARVELGVLPVSVGRGQQEGAGERLSIPFDPTLSRNHFEVRLRGEELHVRRLENKHPLCHQGLNKDEFVLAAGQMFTTGQTCFEFQARQGSLGDPTRSGTVLVDFSHLRELDADRCLQAVLNLQPLLASGLAPEHFLAEALPILAQIIPMASAIFAMAARMEGAARFEQLARIGVQDGLGPSLTLLRQAVATGEPVCYFWDQPQDQAATVIGNSRWAVAAPIPISAEECYVLYTVGSEAALSVTSSGRSPGDLDRAVLAFVAGLLSRHFRARLDARRVEEERRQRELTQRLHEILAALTATLEPAEIARCLSEHLRKLVPCQEVQIHAQAPLEPGQGTGPEGHRLAIPLRRRETVRGGITLIRSTPFQEDEVNLAVSLCAQAATALENAQMFKAVQRQATIDELTQISNRRHFYACAQELAARGESLSVLIFDVDHFKKFNDTYGHLVGDEVLRLVAGQAARCFPPPDALGRYGGEEFAVASACGLEELAQRAEALRTAIEATALEWEGHRLSVTVSLGVSGGSPELKSLLSTADEALYQAKRGGRNRVERSPA